MEKRNKALMPSEAFCFAGQLITDIEDRLGKAKMALSVMLLDTEALSETQ